MPKYIISAGTQRHILDIRVGASGPSPAAIVQDVAARLAYDLAKTNVDKSPMLISIEEVI